MLRLQVTFPPLESANQSIVFEKDGGVRVSFVVSANPAPSEVRWMIAKT